MTVIPFDGLGIAAPILSSLKAENHNVPTPIQQKAIPLLLNGKDLLATAQTGTGKTAAFVVPMLQTVSQLRGRPEPGRPRGLILVPTRELAIQIAERISAYGRGLRVSHSAVFGGVGYGPQIQRLSRGVDILIATPGRLMDLIERKRVFLDRVGVLVLDEADRMLDLGFVHSMRAIARMLPSRRQSMLFSATMAPEIVRLSGEFLNSPERVDIAPKQIAVERIAQSIVYSETRAKPDVLASLLRGSDFTKVLVFTRTKHGADRVVKRLVADGTPAMAIHGNKSQSNRQAALERFRSGRIRVLVATDIAARGIDVADVSHVINYELPNVPETYVHRIGRTARAGTGGIAISLCDGNERAYLRAIERLMGRKVETIGAEPAETVREKVPPKRRFGKSRSNRNAGGGNSRRKKRNRNLAKGRSAAA